MVKPYVAQQTVDDFGQVFSDIKYSASLAATTNTQLTVPSSAPRFKAVMKVENNGLVWVALNATAGIPAGGSFAATASELINDAKSLCRDVKAGDVLNFYTATAGTDVSVVFYAMGNTSGI